MRKILLFVVTALFAVSMTPFVQAKTFVTIGTGGVTGVYYPTGGAISRMVNKKSSEYGIKSTVESTGGSVYNVNAVLAGDLEFGISQSDIQFQAVKGLDAWKEKGPQKKLRSMFALHPEIITIVASEGSGIKTLADMKGKRVNIGNPGSGQYVNSEDVFASVGLKESDVKAEKAKAVEAPALLQDERIDAFFYTVGHPNSNIKEATSGRIKVRFVPVEGKAADFLTTKFPYYVKTYINIKDYPTALNKDNVPAVGVKATLITSSDVPDNVAYAVAKEVFENIDEFKTLHPAFASLTKENMLDGLSAPIHPGALKYYKEAGLDKYIKANLK